MRKFSEIDNELDRLKDLRENLGFCISSLEAKNNDLMSRLDVDTVAEDRKQKCSGDYEILEGRVYSFMACNSTIIDFDLRDLQPTELVGV